MDAAGGDISALWDTEGMTAEEVAELRAIYGLDDPLIVRYGRYMFRLIQGDLGVSDFGRQPVWNMFLERLPNTMILAAGSVFFAIVISIPLGIFAARRAGTLIDSATTAFTMIGMSMPAFWFAALMVLFFSFRLGWLPAAGFNHGFRSIILPSICGAMMLLAMGTRQTRSSMLEILRADFLRTARAKGVPEKTVIRKHALGNALIPIVTTIGASIAFAVSGSAIIEMVFAWPGLGRLLVDSISARDVTTSTSLTVIFTVMYVLILLLVDIAYAFIDPRIKAQYISKSGKKKKARKSNGSAGTIGSTPVSVFAGSVETAADADDAEIIAVAEQHENGFAEQEEPVLACEAAGVIVRQETEADRPADDAYAAAGSAAYGRTEAYSDSASNQPLSETSFSAAGVVPPAEDSGELLLRKYKKNSPLAETFRHLLRNPGAAVGLGIIFLVIVAFIISFFISFESMSQANVAYRHSPPSLRFPFGTDNLGRCSFTRTLYATRFSLPIGIGATLVGAVVGVFLGAIAAYKDGTPIEEVIMRFSDSLASVPGLLLGMVLITAMGRSLPTLMLAIGVNSIPGFIRITRASVLSLKGNEFVEAAKAIGIPEIRILFTQLLPNGLAPIIITFTGAMGGSILVSAGLSFLGFGIPLPYPEWGALIAAGRNYIHTSPWLSTIPGIVIMVTVMGFNLLGDGLRDAFDPKLKR